MALSPSTTDGAAPKLNGRSTALDLLRAVAILLVVSHHWVAALGPSPDSTGGNLLHRCLELVGRRGWIGVDIFFVLSGYLISGLLFKEYKTYETISFKNFIIRRGLKIYPSYYALVFVCLFSSHWGIPRVNVLTHLLFIQNYYFHNAVYSWVPTWTLAIEEHFYILLPLLLIGLSKKDKSFRLLPHVFILLAVSCLYFRIHALPESGGFHPLWMTHLRVDSLFFGVLLSFFQHFHYEKFHHFTFRYRFILTGLGASLLAASLFFLGRFASSPLSCTLLYVASGLLLSGMIQLKLSNPLCRAFSPIGYYSYSIYLWHIPFGAKITAFLLTHNMASTLSAGSFGFFIVFIGSIFSGILMAKLIEFPMLRVREKFFPSRSKAGITPTPAPQSPAIHAPNPQKAFQPLPTPAPTGF